MTPHFQFLLFIATLGFGISSLVETTSWTLRAMSNKSNHGFFNAKANIYLYGGRFFTLLFMMILSFIVDKETDLHHVLKFITISVSFAAFIQLLYWNSAFFFRAVNRVIIFLLLSKVAAVNSLTMPNRIYRHLLLKSWMATSILVFGVTSPYILASIYPDIKMTISTVGQAINAIGTVILLFNVEPLLYRRMDKNDLHIHVFSYIKGRCLGFILAASIFWILLLIIPK